MTCIKKTKNKKNLFSLISALFFVDFNGLSSARNAKYGRPLVVTLLNKENLKLIEFTSEILEQVEEWYQAVLNIIQSVEYISLSQ